MYVPSSLHHYAHYFGCTQMLLLASVLLEQILCTAHALKEHLALILPLNPPQNLKACGLSSHNNQANISLLITQLTMSPLAGWMSVGKINKDNFINIPCAAHSKKQDIIAMLI